MFSKQALPKLDEEPDAPRRFRANVRDLFLTNQLSAERTSTLLGDAAAAGVEALDDVKNIQAKDSKNVHRDLMRKFAKKAKQWPDLYWSKVDVWDQKRQKVKREWVAVLLPHEWLCKLNNKVPSGSLTTWEGLGPLGQRGMCQSLLRAGLLHSHTTFFLVRWSPIQLGQVRIFGSDECIIAWNSSVEESAHSLCMY